MTGDMILVAFTDSVPTIYVFRWFPWRPQEPRDNLRWYIGG